MVREAHSIQCMPYTSQIITEMLPEIHEMENMLFSQISNLFSNNVILGYK